MNGMDRTGNFRVGIDVGGTFTDLFFVRNGEVTGSYKVLTTPEDPSKAMLQGLKELIKEQGLTMRQCSVIIHGTTLVTNAIIERKGAYTALITTEGFRDCLEMGREIRYDIYDLEIERPVPLVPRNLRLGVKERLSSEGQELVPLDEKGAEDLVRQMVRERVQAVGVCFLHAYCNPAHEQRMKEIIQMLAPHLFISLSSEVIPAIREYERTSTTVANAYVQSLVTGYLEQLNARLGNEGFTGQLYLMMSNGAIMTPEVAKRNPVRMLESGPAAGALGAAYMASRGEYPRVVSFDMGGTTAKTCLIDDGNPLLAPEFEAARVGRFKKGSGLPIQIPAIEMIEIGAGGGSVARVDTLGLLKVGPDSSGAAPGPVSYGLGGTEPTVTDADLVLGYLNPDYFLGGKMRLYKEAAEKAILQKIAKPIHMTTLQAAWGIHEVVCENMAIASRIHVLERGRDPRSYVMLAMGGAGPVHAVRVAQKLGIRRVIMPRAAGVFSALGMLVAPVAFDYVRTRYMVLGEADLEWIQETFLDMSRTGKKHLQGMGISEDQSVVQISADMRYRGQGHEIKVLLPDGKIDKGWLQACRKAFDQAYRTIYHRTMEGIPVEVVNWRCVVSAPVENIPMESSLPQFGQLDDAFKGSRLAFFPDSNKMTECQVYERSRLPTGVTIKGPAIIEEIESTAIIHPGDRVVVDQAGNLIVDLH